MGLKTQKDIITMVIKNKYLIFILFFVLGGCVNTPFSKTTHHSDRNEIIQKYLDEGYVKVSHLDEKGEAPPLQVDVVYARKLKDRGWDVTDYRIEFQDVLEISVWEIENLNRTVVVRPDGKVSFPLVGDMQAEGESVESLRKDLTEKLKRYIRNPQVSVIIKKFGAKRATVLRETGGGKVIRFTAPIQVSEVVAQSGGYSSSVNLKKIYIVREPRTKGENAKIIVVNAQNLLRNGDIRENIYIRSKDVVFLARGAYESIAYFKEQINRILEASYKLHPAAATARHTGPIIKPQIGDDD